MSDSKYTSFQVKNTASVPMEVSLTDPDGNRHTVGPLDPGEESIQVAPVGTTWSIRFVSGTGLGSMDMMSLLGTRPGSDATKPGSDATKPGSDATKPGSDATKPGSDATKPGSDATKAGEDAGN
jgi:hypothetical protein